MKKHFLPFLLLICLFLTSCFDIEEVYTLNANGSYKAQFNFDMGEIIKLAAPYMSDSIMQGANDKKDTTLVIGKAIPDSLKGRFSVREMDMLNKTILHIKMDLSNEIMKTTLTNEGRSYDDLHYFLKNYNPVIKKAELTKLLDPKSKITPDDQDSGMNLPMGGDDFDYVISPTVFERKAKPKQDETANAMGQAGLDMLAGMGLKLTHTLIINFPKPVKEVNDPKAVISPDKQQVKVVTDLMEKKSEAGRPYLRITY